MLEQPHDISKSTSENYIKFISSQNKWTFLIQCSAFYFQTELLEPIFHFKDSKVVLDTSAFEASQSQYKGNSSYKGGRSKEFGCISHSFGLSYTEHIQRVNIRKWSPTLLFEWSNIAHCYGQSLAVTLQSLETQCCVLHKWPECSGTLSLKLPNGTAKPAGGTQHQYCSQTTHIINTGPL